MLKYWCIGDPFIKTKLERKVSQCRKKTERGDLLGFFNIHSVGKYQKIVGGPFGGKLFVRKKVSQSRKYPLAPLSFLDGVKNTTS